MLGKKSYKKFLFKGSSAPETSGSSGALLLTQSHSPPVPTPGPRRFWIESPYLSGFRVTLVSVSESGSQKSVRIF